ncbi:mechanosensitive ion channel family protein [Lewinella sp. W8]|uniref:mechanosensitive ion channel family protein n=1 Tax=Lewinella sp. W8 TaxID=2528208 RepID=UPI001068C2C7|nr:mechanosensitive ion channel domain-containing protein [Lewinella sp. W8]MTB50135.1 mechanosensitive ion channel [Lewinella sp. W8]
MEDQVKSIGSVFQEFRDDLLEAVPGIILALLIVVVGIILTRWLSRLAGRKILSRLKDPLMGRFLTISFRALLLVGVVMLALRAAGLIGLAAGLLGGVGAGAIILGFAFRDIGENFISGIVLAFNRPFDVRDTIRVGEHFGKVLGLHFRYTHLKTFDGRDIYIPNSDVLTQPVQNFTADGFIRHEFTVGIAYEDDIEGAKTVIQEVLDQHSMLVHDEEHENFVVEDSLGASTVNLKVFFWVITRDYRASAIVKRGRIIRDVKTAIDANGYNMPADITEIKLYGSERDIPLRIEFDDTPNSEAENYGAIPQN